MTFPRWYYKHPETPSDEAIQKQTRIQELEYLLADAERKIRHMHGDILRHKETMRIQYDQLESLRTRNQDLIAQLHAQRKASLAAKPDVIYQHGDFLDTKPKKELWIVRHADGTTAILDTLPEEPGNIVSARLFKGQ